MGMALGTSWTGTAGLSVSDIYWLDIHSQTYTQPFTLNYRAYSSNVRLAPIVVKPPKHWRWFDVFRTFAAVAVKEIEMPVNHIARKLFGPSIVERVRHKRKRFLVSLYQAGRAGRKG